MSSSSPSEGFFKVNLDQSERMFVNRIYGFPVLTDILEVMLAVRVDPGYEISLPVVWDFSEANLKEVGSEQIKQFQLDLQNITNPPDLCP